MDLITEKKDIRDLDDVKKLVDNFYKKVTADPDLGPIFDDIAKIDWETHLPKMYSFWETLLLGNYTFEGNPLLRHIELDQKVRLTHGHFSRWLELFRETLDENFEGETAISAREKAEGIAMSMESRISYYR